jgi:hypothetical protein
VSLSQVYLFSYINELFLQIDDDRDSGTESDEENIELEEIERQIRK